MTFPQILALQQIRAYMATVLKHYALSECEQDQVKQALFLELSDESEAKRELTIFRYEEEGEPRARH